MTKLKLLSLGLLLGLIFATSCKTEDPIIPIDESQVLAEYLEANGDFINTVSPTIIKSEDVNALNLTGGIEILDIRTATDFAAGHIENAVNVEFANLRTFYDDNNLSASEKVAIVCYTGQTAAYGAALLRLAGYNNVYSMKWGMSSWNADFSVKWSANLSNARATQFVTDPATKNAAGDLPVLETGFETAEEILNARIDALLVEGFDPAKITNATVYDNTANYYLVNYWTEEHYNIGHIAGAIQYTPGTSWKLDTDLKTLPTDKTIVVYCYTGQTSAYVTAYLKVMGYDAKSLLYGANGMIYDVLVNNAMTFFSDTQVHDFTYVVTTK
jgi:rhodanese-related sulfurtransferase